MYRIPLPVPDTTFLLSPRWGDLSSPLQLSLWLLACLLVAGLVIGLYRSELGLVGRFLAIGLLLCRFAVLTILLFLICLQPIVARSSTERLPGRVLIAVDRSVSMDIADPQRPSADKIRLARALKLAGDLCNDAQLDEWVRQYDERGSPSWFAASESFTDQEQRQKIMDERHRLHDQVCQRVDQWTRTEIARRVLSEQGLGLLPALAARHHVELLGFAREAWQAEPGELDRLFRVSEAVPAATGTADRDPGSKEPDAPKKSLGSSFTDLRAPLTRALEAAQTKEGQVLGVVLLTDGQHNRGPSPVAQAQSLGEHRLPIYPVALGSRQAPPDITVVGIKAPSAVFKGADAPVEARLKVSGLPAQDIVVELQSPGQAPLEERLHHDGTDRYYTVPFQVRLEKAGPQSLLVRARPVPGEIQTDNNSRPTAVNVADDTARILLVDGEARWEYHYLANALLRDRIVQLQRVVFVQPRLGAIPEDQLAASGNPQVMLPSEPDALAAFDCIILGDVSPAQLPLEDRRRLEKYVADRGGTLVITAGKRSMPLGFTSEVNNTIDREDPFLKLLPIEAPRVVQSLKGFAVTLSHEGKLTPFLQLEPASDKNEDRWAQLPRHYWGVIGRSKPGATPLAHVRDDVTTDANAQQNIPKKGTVPLRIEGQSPFFEKERALMVRHNYGFGRVLFIGLDSTWRWRYKAGDQYHHRFWGQVVRWAAADKPLVAGNQQVRFGTRDAIYRQGQEIDLLVRLGGEASRLPLKTLAGARIVRQPSENPDASTNAIALVPLARREAQPHVLEGRIRNLPPGQYAMELAIPELTNQLQSPPGPDGKPATLRAPFTVLPPEGEEMVELATNFPLLEELAAKSGGKVFTPENATELVDLLTRHELTREHYSEHRLWQWWVTLVVVLFLLTAEWVARKWVGLP